MKQSMMSRIASMAELAYRKALVRPSNAHEVKTSKVRMLLTELELQTMVEFNSVLDRR